MPPPTVPTVRNAAGRPADGRPDAPRVLDATFFDRDAQRVAYDLLGAVLCHWVGGLWLRARIVEAEAYYVWDKASHASLGFTPSRRSLFMPPGTVYMYYARGGDSFNVSCRGEGNAVLVKAGVPWPLPGDDAEAMLARMHALNPLPSGATRPTARLCAGQTLLCRALGLRVPDWDGRPIDAGAPALAAAEGADTAALRLLDVGQRPARVVQAPRLGIAPHRDADLPLRFVDHGHVHAATRNPLRGRPAGPVTLLEAPPTAPPARPGQGKIGESV